MVVWKNKIAADPTLEEERKPNKYKRDEKSTKTKPLPIHHTRCWACGDRLKVQYDEDPDTIIELHRKTNCRRFNAR